MSPTNRGGSVSRTVDLFLDSDQPLDLLAARLALLTGCQLVASPDGTRFAMRQGEVVAYLAEHDFLDDEDLALSQYRYVLSAVVKGAGELEDSPEAVCLRKVNALFRQSDAGASLLVMDLDRPSENQVGL
ncbi:MAG: hypothetical protein ACP5VR_01260 [Acidimicrobiales bacterium]